MSNAGPLLTAHATWHRLPVLARWLLLYLACLAGPGALGALTPIGAGNAIFLAGAATLLVSIAFVRLGGERKRAGRATTGEPIWTIDPEARRAEIRQGLRIFFLGMALWATLAAAAIARGDLP